MRRFVLVALLAGCGVRAPARVDLDALVRRLGPDAARHDLEVRIVDDPEDLGARLALARLCEHQGRPSQAIDALEAVLRTGGPIGTRWHDDDRARLARLLAARGHARLARGAPTAVADLERARELGAPIAGTERAAAQLAHAIVQLRHVDAQERARGLATLRRLGQAPAGDGLGVYLWSIGARRAAYEVLAQSTSRDPVIAHARLVARAWWTPLDTPMPATDLVGPTRCRFVGCDPSQLVQEALSSDAIVALAHHAPSTPITDPQAAFAWLAITLAQTLREGDGTWAARFAARVDVSAISLDRMPPGGRAAFALVTGRDVPVANTPPDRSLPGRYLAAAVLAFRGAPSDEVRAALGTLAGTPDGMALLGVIAPPPVETPGSSPGPRPFAAAVARYVAARMEPPPAADPPPSVAPQDDDLVPALVRAYAVDPLRADRVARDVVARSPDAAVAHARLGAFYDAIEDPARARASWQAAVAASPEPAYVRGLALAIARANDPDAALVIATQAAAASGDPSVVWLGVAEALALAGAHVHALEAARAAIDLATVETAAGAFQIAIAASLALGRDGQASELRARRARVAPPVTPPLANDPTADPRWNPRDVAGRAARLDTLAASDPRRAAVAAELVRIAGGPDVERGRAAIRALRRLE